MVFFPNHLWIDNPLFRVLIMATSADVPVSQVYYLKELSFTVLPSINYICNSVSTCLTFLIFVMSLDNEYERLES